MMSMIFEEEYAIEAERDYYEALALEDSFHAEINTPKYINCKHGFIRMRDGKLNGFTTNLRTATPFYGSNSSVYEIAKNIMKRNVDNYSYFAVIEPSIIGFNKEKEICG